MSQWTYFSCENQDGTSVIETIHEKLNSLTDEQAATAKFAISDIHSRNAHGVIYWQPEPPKEVNHPRSGSFWNQRIFFTNQAYKSELFDQALDLLNGQAEYCELKAEEAINCHITMTNQRNGDALLTVWWPSNAKLEPVPQDRRYDRTTFAMAHDAHTAMPLTHQQISSQTIKARTALPIDQSRSQEEQLFDGVRAFRITSDLIDGELRMHHNKALYQKITKLTKYVKDLTFVPFAPLKLIGIAANLYSLISGDDQTDVQVQTVFGTVEDYLKNVKKFLDENPHEIISLLDEGDANNEQTEKVLEVYKKVFGADSSGNPNMVYTHSIGSEWPTIGEMIQQNRRLVLFSSSIKTETHEQFPQAKFINNMWNEKEQAGNIWENDYNHHDPEKPVTWQTIDGQIGGVHAPNRLYLYNHFYYTPGVQFWPEVIRKVISDLLKKKIDMSDPTKSFATVGQLLQEDVDLAALELGHPPNFINVDFYQGVHGVRSTLIPTVNKMNRSWGTPIPKPTGELIQDLAAVKQHILTVSDLSLRQACIDFVENKIHAEIFASLSNLKNDLNDIESQIALIVNQNKHIPEGVRAMFVQKLDAEIGDPASDWVKSGTKMEHNFATFSKQQSKSNDVEFLKKWLENYIWSTTSFRFEGTDLWQERQDLIHSAVTHLDSGIKEGTELHQKTEWLIQLTASAINALADA